MAITLESLRRGTAARAPKIVVYGPVKVGKSTFGASAPNPVFIPTEEGLDGLDVTAFPLARTLDDVFSAIAALGEGGHDFQTVVLDSLDWTEPLIWAHVAGKAGVTSIEEVGGGYGKGYLEALKMWRELLDGLDYLRAKGMGILIIAHDEIRRMAPPDGEPYDYAGLKLHKRAAALVEEWADVIGYADQKTATRRDDLGYGKERARSIAIGDQRTLHLGKNPAYVTGNRFAMPSEVPLDWPAFAAHLPGGNPARPVAVAG